MEMRRLEPLTPYMRSISSHHIKSGAEKIEGTIGKPEDLAAAICFVASDEARFINGRTPIVDGGRLAIL
jgi:NAD(P)-dependent dehydrogenase (short-subunit alcohol dehydrogenase family)